MRSTRCCRKAGRSVCPGYSAERRSVQLSRRLMANKASQVRETVDANAPGASPEQEEPSFKHRYTPTLRGSDTTRLPGWLQLPVRRPLRRLRRMGWWPYLALLGPGIVSASAGNDAGGIATYASVGATYGYSFLWAMFLVTISLVVIQEMCARMGAVTGKGLSDLIR